MAVVHLNPARAARTIDIAGTSWPVFKLEALALAVLTCLLITLVTGSLQAAVLTAAALGVIRWIIGAAREPVERSR